MKVRSKAAADIVKAAVKVNQKKRAARELKSILETDLTPQPKPKKNKTVCKTEVSTTGEPLAPSLKTNLAISRHFKALSYYTAKADAQWPSRAYAKVSDLIATQKKPVSCGKEASTIRGIGKASAALIDEFLERGTTESLEHYEEEFGEVDADTRAFWDNQTSYYKEDLKKTKQEEKEALSRGEDPKRNKKKKTQKQGVSVAEKRKIAAQRKQLASVNVKTLQAALRRNAQKITGRRDELVERVAQGIVLGALPLCPLCGMGKLRFDLRTGVYSCPGFRDENNYHSCAFESTNVERTPWKEETEDENVEKTGLVEDSGW